MAIETANPNFGLISEEVTNFLFSEEKIFQEQKVRSEASSPLEYTHAYNTRDLHMNKYRELQYVRLNAAVLL
jgi:hypothetical protein